MDMPLESLKMAMNKEPWLTVYGMYCPKRGTSGDEVKKELATLREHLEHYAEPFAVACEYLSQQPRRKTINPGPRGNSYSIKGYIERWAEENGYPPMSIPNGVLIAAAIHQGFDYKVYPDSPNVHINISNRLWTYHQRR